MTETSGEPAPRLSTPDTSGIGGRIAALDILRGVALLGMILAHCHKMMAAVPASPTENPFGWFVLLGVAEKDRAMFAFMFGVSFALMMHRIEAKGLPLAPLFLRRLFALYLIGFAVEALTRFSILREYAWWGVALLFLRTMPSRTLLVLALLSAAAFSIRDLADSSYAIATIGRDKTVAREVALQKAWDAIQDSDRKSVTGPDYLSVIENRIRIMLRDIISLERLTPNIHLSLFILGLLAVRHGIFVHPMLHLRLIIGMMATGIVVWVFAQVLLPLVPADLITPRIAYRLRTGLGIMDEQLLAFTYLGAIILLLANRPNYERPLRPLGWIGRMALTGYILQATIIEFACAPYGLALKLSPIAEPLATAAVFGTLVCFSKLWLTRFRYGPIEWAWRCLTYWKRLPLRVAR